MSNNNNVVNLFAANALGMARMEARNRLTVRDGENFHQSELVIDQHSASGRRSGVRMRALDPSEETKRIVRANHVFNAIAVLEDQVDVLNADELRESIGMITDILQRACNDMDKSGIPGTWAYREMPNTARQLRIIRNDLSTYRK